jgi:Domain of Unknown Function (DUF1206)
MRSTYSARVSARRASETPAAHALARAGLAARGVIYVLIGWVAILVAIGQSSHEADQRGALQLLASKPYGAALLWLLAIGFAAYALWRFSEAAYGVTGEGNGAGPRLKSLARGVVYAGLAVLTFLVITGSSKSQAGQERDLTASVMRHTGGQVVVGIVGAVIVVVGLALAAEGLRRKFLKHLQTSRMSARTRQVVTRLGIVGTTVRGLVFALVGALVIDAALTHKPAKAGGLDKALQTLHNQPFGQVLLIAVAIGLIVFGAYGLCEAKWRKV